MKRVILIFISVLIIFSLEQCERKKSNCLIIALNEKNETPLEGVRVNVWRKGKSGWLTKKEPLLIANGTTNSSGEFFSNFRFDRGNQYGADFNKDFFLPVDNYWQTNDLNIGANKFTVKLRESNFIKVRVISGNPFNKNLSVYCETETVGFVYYYNLGPTIDTYIFNALRNLPGAKEIKWTIDSSGTIKNFSSTINLNGHDTAFFTINY